MNGHTTTGASGASRASRSRSNVEWVIVQSTRANQAEFARLHARRRCQRLVRRRPGPPAAPCAGNAGPSCEQHRRLRRVAAQIVQHAVQHRHAIHQHHVEQRAVARDVVVEPGLRTAHRRTPRRCAAASGGMLRLEQEIVLRHVMRPCSPVSWNSRSVRRRGDRPGVLLRRRRGGVDHQRAPAHVRARAPDTAPRRCGRRCRQRLAPAQEQLLHVDLLVRLGAGRGVGAGGAAFVMDHAAICGWNHTSCPAARTRKREIGILAIGRRE